MGKSEHVLRVPVAKHYDDVPGVEANSEQLAPALLSLLIAAAHSSEEADLTRKGTSSELSSARKWTTSSLRSATVAAVRTRRSVTKFSIHFRACAGQGMAPGWG